ncbi:MAG: Adaptive-response sensory-kinase SasA [Acidobacteria bacterium]|nr:Adaptive-response sensory-kinase SasA [Acidobacteriota bacterium]
MLDSVRTRLTLWYVGVLALTLVLFSVGVYALVERKLHARLDAGLRTTIEGTTRLFVHEKDEGEADEEAARSALRKYYYPRQAVAIFDKSGRLLKEKTFGDIHATLPASVTTLDRDGLQFYTLSEAQTGIDDGLRTAAQRIVAAPQSTVFLIVCQPVEDTSDDLELLFGILATSVPLALLVVAAGGWFLARKALAPVVAMSERARQISAENLERRLPVANPRDELGQLASAFNELLARLDASFNLQRQFMTDASHELRTPLSVMRTTTQVILEKPRREENEYRDALAMINDQTLRLARIVDDMFTLARADAGRRPLTLGSFYLDELIGETARAASVLAARKGVTVEAAESAEILCYGDEDLLRQMLLNLLDNAIRHTPAGGVVRVNLTQSDSTCEVIVSDTGEGIPVEAQPHIFERFYRVDKARSRSNSGANGANGGGAGLGLSIARWIAEAHNGTIRLAHSGPAGAAFAVELPLKRA